MIKKVLRTAQSYFGALKPLKDRFYFVYRGLMRSPSQPHFEALALFPRDYGGLVVDVGGNIGQSVQSIRFFLPKAKIVSFEPNPNLAQFIKQCFRDEPNVEVRNVGLGVEVGEFKLHVPVYRNFVYDALASFDREHAASWLSPESIYFFNPAKLVLRELRCRVERLDDQKLGPIAFMKIDVEGFESEVIKGGLETIKAHEPVLMIEDFHIHFDIKPILYGLGYRPFRLQGKSLVAGEADTSTFLLTPKWIAELGLASV